MACELSLRLMGRSLPSSAGWSGYPSIAALSMNPGIDAMGHVRTHASQQRVASFDHFVGADKNGRRYCEAKGLGGLEIDDELELCRLFNRQISWLRSPCDAVYIVSRESVHSSDIWAVGQQATT